MSTGANGLTEADLTAVREVWDAMDAANRAADFDAFQDLATEDFVHLDPRVRPLVGIGAWREWADATEFGDFDGQFELNEVAGSGDLAYVRWNLDARWSEGGEAKQARGKGITMFRRGSNGSWKASRNVWNMTP